MTNNQQYTQCFHWSRSRGIFQSLYTLLPAIYLLILLSFYSCQPTPQPESTADFLTAPFDTASVIASMNIIESVSRLDLVEGDSRKALLGEMDCLELRYMAYACDCADWLDPVGHAYAQSISPQIGHQYAFYEGYYIEPAHESLALKDYTRQPGNNVKFFGKLYKEKGWPRNPRFIDPDPPKGKVFRYYAFEIQRPFAIWGPKVLIEGGPEDGGTSASSLTIKAVPE